MPLRKKKVITMLKNRLIACLVIKNGIVVQSIGFSRYLHVGKPEIAIEFLNSWWIDEIIVVDIDASKEGRTISRDNVRSIAKKCFVPLTVGGGFNSGEEVRQAIRSGADKVSINAAAIRRPELITEIAAVLGAQSVIVSMDVKVNQQGKYEVFISNGKEETGLDPVSWAKKVEELGAGEILLNSIDRDGTKQGYDLELIKKVSAAVNIPVIALGGACHPDHFCAGIEKGKAAAVAAANYFHFTEHSVITTKAAMKKQKSIHLRLDTYAHYLHLEHQETDGRIRKPSD